MDTNDKGEFAMLKVKQLALERGILLSQPTMANCRYDLIVDCGDRLVRAQVKYADGKSFTASGSVQLGLRRITRGNKMGKMCYSAHEVDVLLVYLPKIDKILWLEGSYFHGKQAVTIRTKGCLMADQFFW